MVTLAQVVFQFEEQTKQCEYIYQLVEMSAEEILLLRVNTKNNRPETELTRQEVELTRGRVNKR